MHGTGTNSVFWRNKPTRKSNDSERGPAPGAPAMSRDMNRDLRSAVVARRPKRKLLRARCALAAMGAALLALPAQAATMNDFNDCVRGPDIERMLAGCTRLLADPRIQRVKTYHAEVYNNRGNVWFMKGDYDRAITDFDESIRLDPKA